MSERITPGDAPITTPGKHVTFDPIVRVAMLPLEQRVDARKARKGPWKPAPVHDELWDGDILDFREQELTPEEFKALMKKTGNKRSSLPKTLRSLKRLFSVASDKMVSPGRFGGVDVVTARARMSEDFDEDEREEVIPDKPSEDIRPREEGMSYSAGRSSVRVSYVDFDNPPSSPTRSASSPTKVPPPKVTRFEPSPPSEPSPSELKAMELAAARTRTSSISAISEERLHVEEKPPFPKQPILVTPKPKSDTNKAAVAGLLLSKEIAIVFIIGMLLLAFVHRFIIRITLLRIFLFLVIFSLTFIVIVSRSTGKFETKAK